MHDIVVFLVYVCMYNIEMKSGRPARRSFESGQLTAKAYLKDKVSSIIESTFL